LGAPAAILERADLIPDGASARPAPLKHADAAPDNFPDFRNLGVMTRALLWVNAAMLAVAAVKAETPGRFFALLIESAAYVEPVLIGTLVALYLAQPLLSRLHLLAVLGLVLVVEFLLNLAMYEIAATLGEEGGATSLLRAWVYSVAMTLFLRAYFQLRSRAFSPALAEARLQALQARIRPHFLFNSLNAVLSLIRKEPKRAEAAIEDLADLYRVLMADNRTLTSLNDEIELTRRYLSLEQLRLGERLRVEWQLGQMPQDALIPPMLLQPLVENAVYHGIEPGIVPGVVCICIAREGERLNLLLSNPYHPDHQHRAGNRMALANIRERLLLQFDVEAKLDARPVGDQFEIRITMPYRK
jgi:two-component system sensor histidine kinase AlgZ